MVATGNAKSGNSGSINIAVGSVVSGEGNPGSLNLRGGSSDGKHHGTTAGAIVIQSGEHMSDGFGGPIRLETGSSVNGRSGTLHLLTGNATNTRGRSGAIFFRSGNGGNGKSGKICIRTGDGSTAGKILLHPGNSTDSVGAGVVITGGSSTVEKGGNVEIRTGTSSTAASGEIQLSTTAGVETGNIILTTGHASSTSGRFHVTTGNTREENKHVGLIKLQGGIAVGDESAGGTLELLAGPSHAGVGGSVLIASGESQLTKSGFVKIASANSKKSSSGQVLISTGNALEEHSGNITLSGGASKVKPASIEMFGGTGKDMADGGSVVIDGGESSFGNAGHVFVRGGKSNHGAGGDVHIEAGAGRKVGGQIFIEHTHGGSKFRLNNSQVTLASHTFHIAARGPVVVDAKENIALRSQERLNISSRNTGIVATDRLSLSSAKEKVFIQAEDSVRIEAKKSITLDSREGVTIEKLLTVSGTSIFNRCLVQMPSKDARQNSEPIENALLILSQLKPIKYAHGQDGYGQRRFGFATEGVHGQGEIMSSHGMSLSDLSSLIVESVKSLAVKMEKLENSHRKLNGLFEALKSRIGKKTNDNRMNDQNFQDILNLKDKMAKLETYFNKESTKNVQRVEELVKKLESTLDEKVAEFDKFKQEVSKARQESADGSVFSEEEDMMFFIKLMEDARQQFFEKQEKKGMEQVDILALWKSEQAQTRGKMYGRVLARREEANVFRIMDRKNKK
jgi:hypothetical protein